MNFRLLFTAISFLALTVTTACSHQTDDGETVSDPLSFCIPTSVEGGLDLDCDGIADTRTGIDRGAIGTPPAGGGSSVSQSCSVAQGNGVTLNTVNCSHEGSGTAECMCLVNGATVGSCAEDASAGLRCSADGCCAAFF